MNRRHALFVLATLAGVSCTSVPESNCVPGATVTEDGCLLSPTVSPCSTLPVQRDHLGVARLDVGGNQYILATGGLDFGAAGSEAQRADDGVHVAEVDNGTLSTWTSFTLPEGRAGHGIVVMGDRVYLLGGLLDFGDTITADDWTSSVISATFDPATGFGEFRNEADLPESLWHIQAELVDGELVVLGGRSGAGERSDLAVSATFGSDGVIMGWTDLTMTLPGPRTHHGMAVFNNEVFVTGGLGDSNNAQTVLHRGALDRPFERFDTLTTGRITPATFVLGETLFVAGGLTDSGDFFAESVETFPITDLSLTVGTVELEVGVGHIHQVPVFDNHAFIVGGRDSTTSSTDACQRVSL